jgi:hypothetical protein
MKGYAGRQFVPKYKLGCMKKPCRCDAGTRDSAGSGEERGSPTVDRRRPVTRLFCQDTSSSTLMPQGSVWA